jgi:serine/threonine-protein kinase
VSLQPPSPKTFARLDQLLGEALDLPRVERADFLAAMAQDARELSQALALLRAAESAPELEAASGFEQEPSLPAWIGGWQVLDTLGRGGMADVLLGERVLATARQRAAIKLLQAHWDDPESLQRFARERSILAELDDARIARLLDGGVLEDGRPWLALEYVQGQHIDRWCDVRRADLFTRARLVIEVAGAVASAHRRLVVHRDIKPANVLVSESGQVKLLDFGIAKVLAVDAGPSDPETRLTALTPEYASPEQLAGYAVTTASDVYQLGLLLFLLVCGRRPFEASSGHVPSLIRAVSERDAPPPLQVLGRDPQHLQAAAQLRSTTPARLRRALQGDLSALLAKALERDPERRYGSALEFSSDIDRWLRGFPLRARARSRTYRLRRQLQRNPLSSALGLALVLSLFGYGFSTHLQLQRAEQQAELNRSTRDFLVRLFLSAEHVPGQSSPSTALEVLEQGVESTRGTYAEQPRLLAELRVVLGESLISRGEYTRAIESLTEAVGLLEPHAQREPDVLAHALFQLGMAQHYAGGYTEAAHTLRRLLALHTLRGTSDPHADAQLAWVLHSRGEYAQAQTLAQQAWQSLDSAPPALQPLRAEIAQIQGDIARDLGEFESAGHWLALAERLQLERDPDDRRTLGWVRGALAQTLALAGRADPALTLAQSAFEDYASSRGMGHAGTAVTAYRRGVAASATGDLAAARADFEFVLANLDADTIYPTYARIELGWLELADGEWQPAAAQFEAARAALHDINPEHPRLSEIQLGQALLLHQQGNSAAARQSLAAARSLRRRSFGGEHAYVRLLYRLQLEPALQLDPLPAPEEALYETRRLRRALAALQSTAGAPP